MAFTGQLKFGTKLSRGCAEVTISRQSNRMGERLPIWRMLSFYFQHVGYYVTPVLMEGALWFLCLLLLLCALADAQLGGGSRGTPAYAEGAFVAIAVQIIDGIYGPLCVVFALTQGLPWLFELTLHHGPIQAIREFLQAILTLSLFFYSFQAKVMQAGFMRELTDGGADYQATGRGMATERIEFATSYQTYAAATYWAGADLAAIIALFSVAAPLATPSYGFYSTFAVVNASWLFTPSLFNTQAFKPGAILRDDVAGWAGWIVGESGSAMSEWQKWRRAELQHVAVAGMQGLPLRRLLAALFMVILLEEMSAQTEPVVTVGGPMRWVQVVVPDPFVFHAIGILVPVVPVLLAAAVVPLLQAAALTRRFAYPVGALCVAAGHAFEVLVWARAPDLSSVLADLFKLDRSRLIIVASSRYFSAGLVLALLAWACGEKARVAAEKDGPLARALVRASNAARAGTHNAIMAHYLVVDTTIWAMVVLPCLLIACIPGAHSLQTLLIFRILPGRDYERRAINVTTPRKMSITRLQESGARPEELVPGFLQSEPAADAAVGAAQPARRRFSLSGLTALAMARNGEQRSRKGSAGSLRSGLAKAMQLHRAHSSRSNLARDLERGAEPTTPHNDQVLPMMRRAAAPPPRRVNSSGRAGEGHYEANSSAVTTPMATPMASLLSRARDRSLQKWSAAPSPTAGGAARSPSDAADGAANGRRNGASLHERPEPGRGGGKPTSVTMPALDEAEFELSAPPDVYVPHDVPNLSRMASGSQRRLNPSATAESTLTLGSADNAALDDIATASTPLVRRQQDSSSMIRSASEEVHIATDALEFEDVDELDFEDAQSETMRMLSMGGVRATVPLRSAQPN
jgi:hypothetical protein